MILLLDKLLRDRFAITKISLNHILLRVRPLFVHCEKRTRVATFVVLWPMKCELAAAAAELREIIILTRRERLIPHQDK